MEKYEILEILKNVYDPDYKDKSIVELGLVDENTIKINEDKIEVEYKVTAPFCPFSAAIGIMIQYALEKKFGKRVDVKIQPGHYQEKLVEEILRSEEKRKDLLSKLESFGILQRCVRI